MKRSVLILLALVFVIGGGPVEAKRQKAAKAEEEAKPELLVNSELLGGLKLREIGPAIASGRVSDIAVHPTNQSIWYVAVAAGGVWKTVNAGTTWTPIFDGQTA